MQHICARILLLIFSLCTLNVELWFGEVSSHVRQLAWLGCFSSYCHAAFPVIGRLWKIKRQKMQNWGGGICACVFFLTLSLKQKHLLKAINSWVQQYHIMLPSNSAFLSNFTAEEINQAGNKEWRKFRKKHQKPNLSRIKWVRSLLAFSGANWNMFLTHVSSLYHCCLRNFVITKLLWSQDA